MKEHEPEKKRKRTREENLKRNKVIDIVRLQNSPIPERVVKGTAPGPFTRGTVRDRSGLGRGGTVGRRVEGSHKTRPSYGTRRAARRAKNARAKIARKLNRA